MSWGGFLEVRSEFVVGGVVLITWLVGQMDCVGGSHCGGFAPSLR